MILGIVLIIILLLILASCLKIVPQAHAYVIERLGAYQGTWSVGFHIKMPIIDKVAKGFAFLSMPSNPETVICRLEGVVGLKVLIDMSRYTPSVYQTIPSKNSMVLESAASWT